MLGVLEISLSEQAPFYILSPYALGLQSTLDLVASYESSQVSRRLLGVSTNEERVASVYCLAPDPQSASGALLFFEDVLTYDSESSSLAGGDPCNMVGFIGN